MSPPIGPVTITTDEANHVLNRFRACITEGPLGYKAGDFVESLLDAISAADPINRGKLAAGFPGYVRAYRLAQEDEHGLRMLQLLAGGPPEVQP